MAIVDQNYYNNVYFGESVAAADFPRYEARAEQLINSITRGQYTRLLDLFTQKGNTNAAEALTTAYQSAICAQIEYFIANGLLSVTAAQSDDSFTVGRVSVSSNKSSNNFETRGASMISPTAIAFLEQTGLLGRGVSVPVAPFAPFPLEVW